MRVRARVCVWVPACAYVYVCVCVCVCVYYVVPVNYTGILSVYITHSCLFTWPTIARHIQVVYVSAIIIGLRQFGLVKVWLVGVLLKHPSIQGHTCRYGLGNRQGNTRSNTRTHIHAHTNIGTYPHTYAPAIENVLLIEIIFG